MEASEFQQVRNARTSWSVDVAESQTVEFPGAPNVGWVLDFKSLCTSNPTVPREKVAAALLYNLIDDERYTILAAHTTEDEFYALLRDLLRHYDLMDEADPQKAPKTASEETNSSGTSGPSQQTSTNTGASTS